MGDPCSLTPDVASVLTAYSMINWDLCEKLLKLLSYSCVQRNMYRSGSTSHASERLLQTLAHAENLIGRDREIATCVSLLPLILAFLPSFRILLTSGFDWNNQGLLRGRG